MKYFLKDKRQANEEGLVSIVVVTMVIIILSLMTIGFAKIMDRELRQSLDRELAVQANYAAESGMNDARNYVASGAAGTSGDCLRTDLLSATQRLYFIDNGNISGDTDSVVKYTCVNIDTSPNELIYNLKKGESKVFKVSTSATLDKLYFSWNNQLAGPANSDTLPGVGIYPAESFWNAGSGNEDATGVLATTIYQVPSGIDPAVDKNSLLEGLARSYFMYPNFSAIGTGTTSISTNGVSVPGNCKPSNYTTSPTPINTKHFCNSAITNMSPVVPPSPPPNPPVNKNGSSYVAGGTCVPQYAPAPCRITGTSVYALHNYTATYPLAGLGAGTRNYRLTFRYTNHNEPGSPPWPPTVPYQFNVQIDINGSRVVRNWKLAAAGSTATIPLNNIPSGANISFTWDNNIFILPNNWDPNLQINSFTLNEVVTPPVAPPPVAYYYVKLTALYRDLVVSLQGTDVSGASVSFNNAQATIDVTAKGNDVLKRLVSKSPLVPDYNFPQFALESMDTLCKRIRVEQLTATSYGAVKYQDGGDSYITNACSADRNISP